MKKFNLKRKLLALGTSTLILGGALAGCGSGGNAANNPAGRRNP